MSILLFLMTSANVFIFFCGYLTALTIIAILVTYYDKKLAKRKARRISETTLMTLAILGGALGMYLTMRIIRHKTKHKKFMIWLPIIFVIQFLLMLLLYFH